MWEYGGGTGKYTPTSPNTPTESAITRNALRAVEKAYPSAFVVKVHGGQYQSSGLPDVYIMLNGMSIWVEMKRPGADTTKLQQSKLEKLAKAGAYCGTAENTETLLAILLAVMKIHYTKIHYPEHFQQNH